MSALDDYFGPKGKPVKLTAVKTAWPAAPERIRGILDYWEKLVGFHPNSVQVMRVWKGGAWEWVDCYGEDSLALLDRAVRHAQRNNILLKSPGSCVNWAWKFQSQHKTMTVCPECGLDPCECEAEPDQEMVPCPRCGAMIWPEHIDLDCKGHRPPPRQIYVPRERRDLE